MKKIIFVLPLFFVLAIPVFAKNENKANNGLGNGQPVEQSVQNQNQTATQNQGEETQIQVSTKEQETATVGAQNRSEKAVENMSEVAKKVQELLQLKTEGGIGDQVRQVAKEQNQAQTKIQEQLEKLESRKGILKSLLGPDYGVLKNLKAQLEQNQLRIQQLEELKNQLINQEDIAAVEEMIQVLDKENTSLQEMISFEEQTRSMFGWLFRWFVK